MKHFKTHGLLAIAAVAFAVFTNSAAATTTSPVGTRYSGNVHMTATSFTLHSAVTVECGSSTLTASFAAGATSAPVTDLSFNYCGNGDTVSVLKKGTLSISGSGTVTSNGVEITVTLHRSLLGFPVTTHCIYTTKETDIGTLTEGKEPVMHIGSAAIPLITTDSMCGETYVLTGAYKVDIPWTLSVD